MRSRAAGLLPERIKKIDGLSYNKYHYRLGTALEMSCKTILSSVEWFSARSGYSAAW